MAAAKKLRIAQPALSLHMRNIEDELGVKLLHRQARGVVPTEAGDRLLRRAKIVLAEFSQIQSDVTGLEAPSGEARIGLPANITDLFGVRLIQASRSVYPDVRIRVAEGMTPSLLGWLVEGDVDIAMVYGGSIPKGLAIHHAWTEEMRVFGPRKMGLDIKADQPITFAKTATLPLVIPGVKRGMRDVLDAAMISSGIALEPAIEIDSYRQIKQLVEGQQAYGILPSTAIHQEILDGRFISWPIVEPRIELKAYLSYLLSHPLSTPALALGQLAYDVLRGMVAEGMTGVTLAPASNRPTLYEKT
ncbi:MAG: LysR substrate-binding domain-containing protein [Hyphomicrobiales bacterium]|nr:LysR substrate-binding domain-containing protein [Hyphomicrobiales bacterium]